MLVTLVLAALCAQDPPPATLGFATLDNGLRARCVSVPDARGACVLLGVRVGHDHDPPGCTGLAEVVGDWLRLTQESLPPPQRWTVSVHGTLTLVSLLLDDGRPESVRGALQRCAALLAGELPLTDDLAARARAAAALRADDALEVFPGPQLAARARRLLLRGEPAGRQIEGIAAELAAVDRARLESWARAHVGPGNALAVVFAPAAEAALAADVRATLGAIDRRVAAAAVTTHDALPPPPAETSSERVAAPYGGYALLAPAVGDERHLAFLVAMDVLARHAWAAFRDPRGGESQGRASPFSFRFHEGERVVLLVRRGRDGDPAAAVRAELDRFLDRIARASVALEEVAVAAGNVARILGFPPYDEIVAAQLRQPAGMFARARLLLFGEVLGWSSDLSDRIGRLPVGFVQRVLAESVAGDRRLWVSLSPRPKMP